MTFYGELEVLRNLSANNEALDIKNSLGLHPYTAISAGVNRDGTPIITTLRAMGNFIKNSIIYLLCLFLLCGCFPSFSPQKEEYKRIKINSNKIVLFHQIGTLDQVLPNIVYFINKDDSILIYKGDSVKDINIKEDTLMIRVKGKSLYSCDKIKSYKVKVINE